LSDQLCEEIVTPSSISLELSGPAAVITIDRQHRRNALDSEALRTLSACLRQCAMAEKAVIIVRGAGVTAFSAGADIKELAPMKLPAKIAITEQGQALMDEIEHHSSVVIAAIEGYCLGGGLELALACDFRIAGQGTQLGFPEIHLNAFPSWGGTVRLPRIVGPATARALIFLGTLLGAAEAEQCGLIHEMTEQGRAVDRAQELAAKIAGAADARTIGVIKGLLVHGMSASPRAARHLEYLADTVQQMTDGMQSALSRFARSTKAD
jgi:enoyl-CoA hydratase